MKKFELPEGGIKVCFYSPAEYKTNLGGSLEGDFVAAMESYLFHYEDAQDDPVEGLSGVWLPESDTGPDAVGGVATELFRIPYEDIVIDKERGLVLLKRWSPELFETTGLNLDDMRDEGI